MKSKNQEGWLAIEAMAAVMVMLISIPIFYSLWAFTKAEEEQSVIAGQLKTIGEAFEDYVQDNYTTLKATATPTSARSTSFATLQAGGYVRSGISGTNIWGQGYVNYVLQPKPGTLEIITLTTGGTRNDTDFKNQIVPGTAVKMGSKGGYIPSGLIPTQVSTTMQGSYNGWQKSFTGTNIPNPGAGHLVYYSSTDDAAAGQDFLYRKSVPGNPDLNKMETALNMGNNAIDAAGNITSGGNISAAGNVDVAGNITTPATVTAANNHAILYDVPGQGGVAKLVGANGVAMHLENLNGTFRMVNSPWSAQIFSVDQAGNTNVAGNITTPATVTAGAVTLPGGNSLKVGCVYYYGDATNSAIRQNGGLHVQHLNGTSANISQVGSINSSIESWGLMLRNGGNADNAAPTSAVGSAYVNDIYIRSIGKWASQLGGGPPGTLCGATWYDHSMGWMLKASCQGYWPGIQGCPPGYYTAGTMAAQTNWGYTCAKY